VGDGLIAAHIIARVHSEVEHILPTQPSAGGAGRDGDVTCIAA
jgi:microcompartment protein CcmL/EutN